jgi:hypothetical protein
MTAGDDRRAPPAARSAFAGTHFEGDLLNTRLLARLVTEYEIDVIYHLAALLSTRAEHAPEAAHQVNVEGTLGCLMLPLNKASGAIARCSSSFPVRSPPTVCPTVRPSALSARARIRMEPATHHVRLQQALLRAAGRLLSAALSTTCSRIKRKQSTSAACASPG